MFSEKPAPYLRSARTTSRSILPSMMLIIILQHQAVADNVSLRALYGYSINAEWNFDELDSCSCSNDVNQYVVDKYFTTKIYVSTKGRLFHVRDTSWTTRNTSNPTPVPTVSKVTGNSAQELTYAPDVGFTYRWIAGDFDQGKSTFVRVAQFLIVR